MLKTLFLLVTGHALAVRGQCHPGWLFYDGLCFGFSQDHTSWGDAMFTTVSGSVSGHNGLIFVGVSLSRCIDAWLGATDVFHEGSFEWVSDRVAIGPFSDWHSGEPNHIGQGEHCLIMHVGYDYEWNDLDCYRRNGFICQMGPRPLWLK